MIVDDSVRPKKVNSLSQGKIRSRKLIVSLLTLPPTPWNLWLRCWQDLSFVTDLNEFNLMPHMAQPIQDFKKFQVLTVNKIDSTEKIMLASSQPSLIPILVTMN